LISLLWKLNNFSYRKNTKQNPQFIHILDNTKLKLFPSIYFDKAQWNADIKTDLQSLLTPTWCHWLFSKCLSLCKTNTNDLQTVRKLKHFSHSSIDRLSFICNFFTKYWIFPVCHWSYHNTNNCANKWFIYIPKLCFCRQLLQYSFFSISIGQ
jgi:hypothetical protein